MPLEETNQEDFNTELVNQTIKLSGIKQFSQTPLANEVEDYSYQPNFILVDANGQQSKAIFGDIVPLYSSYDEVITLIVTSVDSLYDFILHSSVFMVCLLSFANQLINNIAYHSYLVVVAGYQEVMELPARFNRLKNHYTELLELVVSADTRSLLILEVKLDIQTALNKLLKLYRQASLIAQKLYLSIIVIACLGLLSLSSIINDSSTSFLSKFLSNNTVVNSSLVITNVGGSLPQVASASAVQNIPIKRILEHTVVEGEDLSLLSDMYSINVETIKYNNRLSTEPQIGDKLYIPWTEGYIYNTEKNISPEQLAQIFEVDAESVKAQNQAHYNPETNEFSANYLVLIPSTDFAKIDYNLTQEREREKSLKAIAEQEAARKAALSRAAVTTTNTYKGVNSGLPKSGTFNWPTQGTISRCVQPGHIACDVANFSAPPIFAMQGGVVVSSGWDSSGYGNMVTIDHGIIDGKRYKTLYAHMSEIYVSTGEYVQQNSAIGKMGSTGYSTGIHLHFEVIVDGQKQNPLNYLN